jgi:hypothetical protein
VPVRGAPTASVLTRSRPTESHRNRRQVRWQCGGTGHLRRERDFEGEIKGLRTPTAELEAALERKAGAQRRVTWRTVRVVTAAAPDRRKRAALRREQLASDRVKAHQKRLITSTGPNGILKRR